MIKKWSNLQERTKKVLAGMFPFTLFWFTAFMTARYIGYEDALWYPVALFWLSIVGIAGSACFVIMEYVEYLDCKGLENRLENLEERVTSLEESDGWSMK